MLFLGDCYGVSRVLLVVLQCVSMVLLWCC